MTVTALLWPVLAAIGDGCSVAELAADLGLTERAVLHIVHDLVSLGLDAVVAPQNNYQVGTATSTRLG